MSSHTNIRQAVSQAESVLGRTPGYSVFHFERWIRTLETLLRYVPPRRDGRVADVGVWPGYQSLALTNLGYLVTGYDLDPSRMSGFSFPVIQQDLLSHPLIQAEPESLDAVVATELIEHMPADLVPHILQGFLQALRPGGIALITTPNARYVGSLLRSKAHGTDERGHGHTKEYTLTELRHLFEHDWDVLACRTEQMYRGVGKISDREYYRPLSRWWQHPRKVHNLTKLGLEGLQTLIPPVRDTLVVVARKPAANAATQP